MGKDITFFVSKIPYSSKRIIDLNYMIVPFSKKVLSFLVKSTIVFGENLSPRFKKRRNSVNDL